MASTCSSRSMSVASREAFHGFVAAHNPRLRIRQVRLQVLNDLCVAVFFIQLRFQFFVFLRQRRDFRFESLHYPLLLGHLLLLRLALLRFVAQLRFLASCLLSRA